MEVEHADVHAAEHPDLQDQERRVRMRVALSIRRGLAGAVELGPPLPPSERAVRRAVAKAIRKAFPRL